MLTPEQNIIWDQIKKANPMARLDPVSQRTSWKVCGGLQNETFCTNRFSEINGLRAEFRQGHWERHISFGLMELCGLLITFAVFADLSMMTRLTIAPIGVALGLVGFLAYTFNDNRMVFDKKCGMFWKGKHMPDDAEDPALDKNGPAVSVMRNFCRLDRIHAVQVVCGVDSANYLIYEINLVLEDSTRTSVLKNVAGDKVKEDAAKLAAFLKLPLWDASIDYNPPEYK